MAKLGPPRLTDARVAWDLEDERNILLRTLPTRTYNNNSGTDAYTQTDRGRVRPLLFGTKTGIRPVQYDIHYTGGGPVPLGEYEIMDMLDWPAGMEEPTAVYWYADDQAAAARSNARRTTATKWGSSLSALVPHPFEGRFTVLRDLRPIEITQENNKLYFDTGGGTLMAAIATGVYPLVNTVDGLNPTGLLATIQAAMRAVDGADIVCDFTLSTQKVRIAKGAGTLSLLCATGSDVQNGIWEILGFDASADKTGSLTYNADNVFTSQAGDQTIRVDVSGFVDDTGGPYTGIAGDPIEKAPDIARFILREILKVPASAIDTASFVAARTGAGTKPCSLYIGSPRTVADIFAELETSGNMDLLLKGGVWYCVTRDTSVPAGTPELMDTDFLEFESYYDPEDLFGTVTLTYNEAPDGGDPIAPGSAHIGYKSGSRTEMGETTDAAVALRHGRPHQMVFKTCLRDKADAVYPLAGSRLEAIAARAQAKRRRFRFTVKGKCLQTPVNGKIRLTRARGLAVTGALSNLLVRVISKRDDWARWVSEIEAIEFV